MGGGSIKTAVLDDGVLVHRSRVDYFGPFEEVLPGVVADLTVRYGVSTVGVGLAGLVDPASGLFVWGPHHSATGVDVPSLVGGVDHLVVDNDANLAALGEASVGAAKGFPVSITVSVGTGIGAGIVIDGEIFRGDGLAGEVGHMQLLSDGENCLCGSSGCWETLVSGTQLDQEAANLGLGSAVDLVAAAESGDVAAQAMLSEAGRWLGVGVRNLALAIDPSVVVLAGGVSYAAHHIIDPANRYLSDALPGAGHRPVVRVVQSRFGRWAAAVGAALVASGDTLGDVSVDV